MRRQSTTDELYFLTITIVNWVDVFTRREYKDYLITNLEFCQKEKGLEVYAYVIMTNHIHLVARMNEGLKMSEWLRDFKSFTSKGIYKLIKNNQHESRKEWMLEIFEKNGSANELNKNFQVWQNGSHPTILSSANVIQQKIDYIHNNPVRAGMVAEAHEYLYSSANPDSPMKMNSEVIGSRVSGSSEDA